jgi:hypothetical protein
MGHGAAEGQVSKCQSSSSVTIVRVSECQVSEYPGIRCQSGSECRSVVSECLSITSVTGV